MIQANPSSDRENGSPSGTWLLSLLWPISLACLGPFSREPAMGTWAAKGQSTFPFTVGIRGKGVVEGPHDLVHALHVGNARVELGIDEQDALHHLPVGLTAIGQHLVLIQGRRHRVLVGGAHLERRGRGQLSDKVCHLAQI